jgi:hypothetical protein
MVQFPLDHFEDGDFAEFGTVGDEWKIHLKQREVP